MDLTRSTVGEEPPDPKEEVLNDVLHWVWSWRLQLDRLIESTDLQGQGETATDKRRSYSRASYDEHLVAVVGWNVARAIRQAAKLFPEIRLADDKGNALRLLRHLYEHWDEQRRSFQDPTVPKKRSASEFVNLFPTGKPWSIVYAKNDWLLGGVVPLKEMTDELGNIEAKALELENVSRKR